MSREQFQLTGLVTMTAASIKETSLISNGSIANKEDMPSIEMHTLLISTVWGIITFIGTSGNLIVIFTMCRHTGRSLSRSATNCYIMNVAIADLAFNLMVVPISAAAYVSVHWEYGEAMCKITNYFIFVTLMSTCLTLTAMTIDRYFAIVHPLRSLQRRTPKSTIILCIGIWIASFTVCTPFIMFYEVQLLPVAGNMMTICLPDWPPVWKTAVPVIVVLVTYVIPLSVIIASYTLIMKFLWRHKTGIHRELNQNSDSSSSGMSGGATFACKRKKVAKIVAAVVILFAISWLPVHVINLCFALNDNIPMSQSLYNFKIFAHTLSYTNSCVNPFVYTIMGNNFRKAFMESVCRRKSSSSSSSCTRTGYSRRTGSVMETRFNGE